jgi:hypothetical protein
MLRAWAVIVFFVCTFAEALAFIPSCPCHGSVLKAYMGAKYRSGLRAAVLSGAVRSQGANDENLSEEEKQKE